MTRRRNLILTLAILVAALILLFAAGVGYTVFSANRVERNFLSHELNKKLYALNPQWSTELETIDVSSFFARGIPESSLRTQLQGIGYECSESVSVGSGAETTFACTTDAGANFVCNSRMVIFAVYDKAARFKSAKANYFLICF